MQNENKCAPGVVLPEGTPRSTSLGIFLIEFTVASRYVGTVVAQRQTPTGLHLWATATGESRRAAARASRKDHNVDCGHSSIGSRHHRRFV